MHNVVYIFFYLASMLYVNTLEHKMKFMPRLFEVKVTYMSEKLLELGVELTL